MIMRLAIMAGVAALAAAAPAHADALRRTVAPMMRADGAVCDLLRAELGDTCKRVAHEGSVAVYQSRSTASDQGGIRRLVLAIDTGTTVLVSPAVDLVDDQLASARPTLRAVEIDGKPGFMLDVVSTWKRGKADEHSQSLVGCAQTDSIWKCSLVDAGACDASVAADGSVTTSCGTSSTLSIATRS